MDSPEGGVSDPRDAWMRRAGPFFGLLVAARGQTRLPLAPELEPTDGDRRGSVPWSPAVGALLGLALGFAAAILGELGLAAGVVAALIACLWVVAGGGWSELGTARASDRLIGRDGGDSGSLAVVLSIALVVSLLLRVAALVGIQTDYWTEVLIVAPLVARWTPVGGALTRALLSMRKSDEPGSLPVGMLAATGAVVAVAIIIGGSPGIFALAIAALTGAGLAVLGIEDVEAQTIFAIELVTLLCFAAADTYPLL